MIDVKQNKIGVKVENGKLVENQIGDLDLENVLNRVLKKNRRFPMIRIVVKDNLTYFISNNKKSIRKNLAKFKELKTKSQKKSLEYLSNKKELENKEREEAQNLLNLELEEEIKREQNFNKDLLKELDLLLIED